MSAARRVLGGLFGLVCQYGLKSTSGDYMRGNNGLVGNKISRIKEKGEESAITQTPRGSFLL